MSLSARTSGCIFLYILPGWGTHTWCKCRINQPMVLLQLGAKGHTVFPGLESVMFRATYHHPHPPSHTSEIPTLGKFMGVGPASLWLKPLGDHGVSPAIMIGSLQVEVDSCTAETLPEPSRPGIQDSLMHFRCCFKM